MTDGTTLSDRIDVDITTQQTYSKLLSTVTHFTRLICLRVDMKYPCITTEIVSQAQKAANSKQKLKSAIPSRAI